MKTLGRDDNGTSGLRDVGLVMFTKAAGVDIFTQEVLVPQTYDTPHTRRTCSERSPHRIQKHAAHYDDAV